MLAVLATTGVILYAGAETAHAGSAPVLASSMPSLPGVPPDADTGYPAAPATASEPLGGAVGPATRLSASVSPGLVGSTAILTGHTLALTIACTRAGRATLTDPAIHAGPLAKVRYACADQRAKLEFTLSGANAAKVKSSGTTTGTIDLGTGPGSGSTPISVGRKAVTDGSWGSDGGLQCTFYGSHTALLVAPNFTVTPDAVIDIRPWLAYYTVAGGWHWVGTEGPDRSSWTQWTAGSAGVAQWFSPAGALDRWSWEPISMPTAQPTWVVAGFEVVYLYSKPRYAFALTSATTASGAAARMCPYN